RRYTESDIRSFLERGWKIWCLSVADKFGDSGITGAIMVNGDEIDTLLLSCRILGKGIEKAFLTRVLARLKDQGIKSVKARYIPTAKNSQVAGFYDRAGFSQLSAAGLQEGEKLYCADLETIDLQIDSYYHIN
ncbi:MAG: hypothetical protein J6L98_06655, partial [Bacteroidales bacterium]|nr:hypothetical protein [Bacteroidales bacterium]